MRLIWRQTFGDTFEDRQQFALGTKNKTLKYGADGSLTLYLGSKSPGKDKEANWLPAPSGDFSLILRHYWPDTSIIDGTWLPPEVELID